MTENDEECFKAHAARIREMTPDVLRQLGKERLQWAIDAEDRDLHGSAKEWRLTASLAFRLATLIEQQEQ
jgi:hypothetical protein